jgi:hypothetical protein
MYVEFAQEEVYHHNRKANKLKYLHGLDKKTGANCSLIRVHFDERWYS